MMPISVIRVKFTYSSSPKHKISTSRFQIEVESEISWNQPESDSVTQFDCQSHIIFAHFKCEIWSSGPEWTSDKIPMRYSASGTWKIPIPIVHLIVPSYLKFNLFTPRILFSRRGKGPSFDFETRKYNKASDIFKYVNRITIKNSYQLVKLAFPEGRTDSATLGFFEKATTWESLSMNLTASLFKNPPRI